MFPLNTRYYVSSFICSFAFCTAVALPALSSAEESEGGLSFDAAVSFQSDYMFRGLLAYDGPSIQPSFTIGYEGDWGAVSISEWLHLSGDTENTADRFTELDSTFKYSRSFGDVTVAVGHIFYHYSDYGDDRDIKDSKEVFGSVAVDTFLAPTLSVFHDYDTYDNQYYELAVSHEFTAEGGSFTPFAAFGFASNAEKVYEDDGLEQITIGSTFALQLGKVAVTPNVNYTFGVDDLAKDRVWFGTTFGVSF